jgi:nitrite reductase/ring-hydroxylating ferredoxin subunit
MLEEALDRMEQQLERRDRHEERPGGTGARDAYLEFLREYPRTGPGTRGGAMLRSYWHPLCLSSDLKDVPYPVRMLGENLVAFRDRRGSPALLAEQCSHRCTSLAYAQIEDAGLKCSYHGWTYDARGRVVDMPLEPADSPLKDGVRHTWYAVREWAGVVWCYMGEDKENPPPLPKIDILARTDGELQLSRGDVRSYNYLNWAENFVDMGHLYVLHLLVPPGLPADLAPYCDMSVDYEWRRSTMKCIETHFGMKSVVVHNTSRPDVKFLNTWSWALPGYFRFGAIGAGIPPDFTDDRRESGGMVRIIDDGHFEIFRYQLLRPGNYRGTFWPRESHTSRGLAEGLTGLAGRKEHDTRKYGAWEGRPPVEDLVMQESQGVIPPREQETLGTSDAGVALLRRIYRQSFADMANGRRPKAVVTDADGILRVDTFKGFARIDALQLGPANMPSSEDGRGLIRDAGGRLVFA